MLEEVSKNIHHALKPGKYFTVILHEEDQTILKSCVKAISSANFKLVKNDQKGDYNIYTFKKNNS